MKRCRLSAALVFLILSEVSILPWQVVVFSASKADNSGMVLVRVK